MKTSQRHHRCLAGADAVRHPRGSRGREPCAVRRSPAVVRPSTMPALTSSSMRRLFGPLAAAALLGGCLPPPPPAPSCPPAPAPPPPTAKARAPEVPKADPRHPAMQVPRDAVAAKLCDANDKKAALDE